MIEASTYVFRHDCEEEARKVFAELTERWPMMPSEPAPTRLTGWSMGDAMSVIDAVRLALECRKLDRFEQRDLALTLVECTSWERCLATFSEWELAVVDGDLVDLRDASADRNPEGEDPQGLRAKHESAVRDSGDAQ